MPTTTQRDVSTRIRLATAGSLSPTIEWRASTTPFAVQTGLGFTGSGYGGAIPVGTNSNIVTVRLYNNFQGGGGIADATSCVLACYDDAIHSGLALSTPTTGLYLQVMVIDYNGVTTGQDTQWYGIGGTGTKHAIPVNGGTIGGASTNYVTIQIRYSIPANATQGAVSQGVWLEYNASA